jgi:HK97 family phage prohead protease
MNEVKNYRFEVKDVDSVKGLITLKHATWDIDKGNDEIEPDAFNEQYKSVNPEDIGFLLNHHEDQPIGKTKQVYANKEGAFTVAKFGNDPLGQGTMEMTLQKLVSGVSLGYVAERKEFTYKGSKRIRKIKKIKHSETSILVGKEPMNDNAGIVDVKSFISDRREYIRNLENFCRTSKKAPDSLLKQLAYEVKEMKRELDEYTTDDFINDCERLEQRLEAERKGLASMQRKLFSMELQRLASKF